MSSEKRPWFWIASLALAVAAAWWLYPQDSGPGRAPSFPDSAEAIPTPEPQQQPQALAAPAQSDTPADGQGEPFATPLPREEVLLPEKQRTADAGVASDDPISREEKRDRMLGVVLDRLQDDLRAAQEAGDEEQAAQLKIRIDRLEQRRSELSEK
ncbi:MAG: hypothetical protein WBN29_07905 [Polyangiales bacterium]